MEGLRVVGIDEKSFGKGQDYVSLMVDVEARRVLEVVDGADQQSVENLWGALPEKVREEVRAAAMDRGVAMVSGTRSAAAKTAIVHDQYYISAELNKSVEEVRRAESKKLSSEGDEILKGSRYICWNGWVR